jgi:hypothetical protein
VELARRIRRRLARSEVDQGGGERKGDVEPQRLVR